MPKRVSIFFMLGKVNLILTWKSVNIFLIFFRKRDAQVIFRDAANMNMTDAGYAWITTEQALSAENVPEGILGLKLVNATNEKAHIRDSM